RLRHWLGKNPGGVPWLTVSPNCPYFARTLPSLISDETKPEDVDTDGEDHAADEARYFVMSRPTPGSITTKPAPQEWSIGWLKARSASLPGLLGRRETHVG